MKRNQKEQRAAEYVLGSLEDRWCVALEMASDSEMATLVSDWEILLSPLADSVPDEMPSQSVWERIAAGVEEASRSLSVTTIYAEQGRWLRVGVGIEAKVLWIDRANSMRSCLLRCAPGARLAPHEHPRTEECLVLMGDLAFGPLILGPGDYHVVEAGQPHPQGFTHDGCLLFLRTSLTARVA